MIDVFLLRFVVFVTDLFFVLYCLAILMHVSVVWFVCVFCYEMTFSSGYM